MHAWILPTLVSVFGVAILGVQWLVFTLQKCAHRNSMDSLYITLSIVLTGIMRRGEESKLRFNHIDKALDEHDTTSKDRHDTVAEVIASAVATFESQASDLQRNALHLKQHAQELLDRAEAHAISPRQVVTR